MNFREEFTAAYPFQANYTKPVEIDRSEFSLIVSSMFENYNALTSWNEPLTQNELFQRLNEVGCTQPDLKIIKSLLNNEDCAMLDVFNQPVPPVSKENICFILEENCESHKEWDWDFVLNRIYSCLKDVAIFVNDDYYYNIFKRNGFKVRRYWPGHLIAPIYDISPEFDLRLGNIDKTFCRLSSSRHDHNYYIHKFLVEKRLLDNTHWSYSKCDHHEWYYNFNRFLNLRERDYVELPEQEQPGSHIGQMMTSESLQPHINSAVTINCETVFHGHGPCHSEKLIKCANLARPFIEVSSPHTLKDLHKWGFESFSDLIDESYDDIEDPHKRIEHICGEIDRLSKMPLQYFKDYIVKNEEKLHHNFAVGQRMAHAVFEQNYHGLILP